MKQAPQVLENMINQSLIVHNLRQKSGWINLNHAATNPLSHCAAKVMQQIVRQAQEPMDRHLGEWIGIIERARRATAELIGVHPDEIAFTQNTSSGLSLIAEMIPFKPGERILYDMEDFPSNQYIWQSIGSRKSLSLEVHPFKKRSDETISEHLALIDLTKVRLITMSLVSYYTGERHDIEAVSTLCQERGILLCLDAIQAVGALNVDLGKLPGVSFLACGGQKWLHGPLGSGFIFVRKRLIEEMYTPMAGWTSVDKAGQFRDEHIKWLDSASRYEAGLPDIAAVAALGKNIELYNKLGMAHISREVLRRSAIVRDAVEKWPVSRISTASPKALSGIVAFELDSATMAETIARRLEEKKIIVTRRDNYYRIAPHFHTPEKHIYRTIDIFSHYMTAKFSRIAASGDEVNQFSGRLATIIGATGTLGSAISEVMAHRKYRLLLIARDGAALDRLAKRLSEAHGIDIEVVNSDLSSKDDVESLATLLASRESDFFAYTATVAQAATAAEQGEKDERDAFAVNYFTPVKLARSILPGMKARKRGKLLFIATSGSRFATPLFSAYAASKGALWAWTESLSQELSQTDISCTIAIPPHMTSATQQKLARIALRHFKVALSNTMADPHVVAKQLVDATYRGETVWASLNTKIKHAINALSPRFMRRLTLARYKP
jgi:selenocysteine lyase/cysteine desulfurase/short-subunit dehydrogenase